MGANLDREIARVAPVMQALGQDVAAAKEFILAGVTQAELKLLEAYEQAEKKRLGLEEFKLSTNEEMFAVIGVRAGVRSWTMP